MFVKGGGGEGGLCFADFCVWCIYVRVWAVLMFDIEMNQVTENIENLSNCYVYFCASVYRIKMLQMYIFICRLVHSHSIVYIESFFIIFNVIVWPKN